MNDLLKQIAKCIEYGKINKEASYPPEMKGLDGADELTLKALQADITPNDILTKGFVTGMDRVGKKFSEHRIFVPQMLMSAKAMTTAMKHLEPFFQSGEVKQKGTFIIGTVRGDLHDIGKNLVAMMVQGSGWEVLDLGVNVSPEVFVENVKNHPGSNVGLSALLTTTMINMEQIVREVKSAVPHTKVLVGGAPVNHEFSNKIGADFYSPDPHGAVEYLNTLAQ